MNEEQNKVFGEKDVKMFLEECEGSHKDLFRVNKWVRKCFGRKHFSPIMSEMLPDVGPSPLQIVDSLHTINTCHRRARSLPQLFGKVSNSLPID